MQKCILESGRCAELHTIVRNTTSDYVKLKKLCNILRIQILDNQQPVY